MVRYSAYVSERYDDEAPVDLHRICGAAIGLATDEWPRWHGRPMQHAFTIDLAELELEVPSAAGARALSVFVDSYYELDLDSSEGITVVWLTQAQIDAHPESTPPDDFEPELRPNREAMDEEGGYYETGEPMLTLERDEDEGEKSFGDSFVGGEPAWGEAGEPAERPGGAFVLQVMSYEFPISRSNSCLFVFEHGAYLQAEYPDDDRRPLPWAQALARSLEIVLLDQPPAPDALQRWGGLPRGVSSYSWPRGLTHIVTWLPESKPENSDAIAYSLFGRITKDKNWDDELTFYQVLEIVESDLDDWIAEDVDLPDGVELLEERAIELRELPPGLTWRDLQSLDFIGPRPAWRRPDRRSAREVSEGTVLQLTEQLLPVSPGRGTMHLTVDGHPIWHPAYGAPQASHERYEPDGTLYAEDTTAAIVVGWHLEFRQFSVLPEKVEALERTLQSALAIRDLKLQLFVPGDTTTDRNGEVHGGFVLGRSVVVVEANDYDPEPVDLQTVATALAELPELDDAFWRAALAFVDIEPPTEPGAYMLSWGPLCYAALYAGVAATRDQTPVYKFIANQDMSQQWSDSGVDGVHLRSVEFSDIGEFDLTPERLEVVLKLRREGGEASDKLDKPRFWLICRYD
jgi:hypothetical protein